MNLVQAGGYVAVLDLDEDLSMEIMSELGQEKGRFFQVDVSKTESIASAVANVLVWTKYTGMEVGGVVAAAGVGYPAKVRSVLGSSSYHQSSGISMYLLRLSSVTSDNYGPQIINNNGDSLSLEDFTIVMSVNVGGTVDLCRQILPHLTSINPAVVDEGERGVLILVSSAAAFDGQPGQVAYSASKGAIVSLTLPLTRELARYGVRVVTIAPGLFKSNLTRKIGERALKSLERVMEFPVRVGRPEEFARVVREAVENSMLNGTVIRLDGGMRMPSKM